MLHLREGVARGKGREGVTIKRRKRKQQKGKRECKQTRLSSLKRIKGHRMHKHPQFPWAGCKGQPVSSEH